MNSTNGKLPAAALAKVDGWAQLTPATAAAFLAAAAYILLHFGIRPRITRPYGAYRDLATQRIVKAIYGLLAAAVGYSPHGLGIAFDMDNVMAVARAVGGIEALDHLMARFGFYRNASNGSGGIEEWHYTLVAVVDLAAVSAATQLIPPPPITGDDTMRVIRSTTGNNSGAIALITECAGAKTYTFPELSIAAATAKVFNPTGTWIDVTREEFIVLVDEAAARKALTKP